jgi:NADH-quinone oxidoreductase subunit J
MSYEEGIFYFVAAVTVLGALGVVLARNVVHSALFLILALLAVTILILFAMMLTRVRDMPSAGGGLDGPQRPFAALAAGAFLGISVLAAVATDWEEVGATDEIHHITIEQIGDVLFRNWAVPFEMASLVLMVALIGAIILARGEEGE